MARYRTEDIRNIALVGHGGAGKTTLVERMLQHTGVLKSPGSVERGTTVSDFDPLEKAHGHSLHSKVIGFDYRTTRINLIDTPGYPDFLGRALAVLPAVETVAVVVNAQTGVQMVTSRMMEWAKARDLDRLVIVNHIDADHVELETTLQQIRAQFGAECLPLNLPADGGGTVVDCFFAPDGRPTDFSSVTQAHTELIDQVVEVDDALMEMYLEQGQSLSPEQLHEPFEKALREGHLIPVCFVSARTGAGLDQLLEVFARLLPNPMEGNPPVFLKGEGPAAERVPVAPDPARHALAHVFRVAIDPFVGRLGVFRIHQGTITKDSQLFIGDGRKPFKVGHLFALQGKDTVEVPEGIPGDICAVAKIDDIHFDAVLHDSHEEDHMHLRSLTFPTPMHGIAIHARSRGDEQRLSDTLHKLSAEDPSVRIEHNSVLNETVLRGLGDLHVRVMLETMKERFNVEVETRPPRIAYRETVTLPAEGHHRHKKQTGGAGQFARIKIRFEPLESGAGFVFENAVVGGSVPREYVPGVEKGLRSALAGGAIAGFPMVDLSMTLVDGAYHDVDSSVMAFEIAARAAFREAAAKAGPALLEPVMAVEVVTPEEYMGDIIGDLNSRRGHITGMEPRANAQVINAMVPLATMFGYVNTLRSLSQGRAQFTMTFDHYEPVPQMVAQEIQARYA